MNSAFRVPGPLSLNPQAVPLDGVSGHSPRCGIGSVLGNTFSRTSSQIGADLLRIANRVRLEPLKDGAVFYHGNNGGENAATFVSNHLGSTRLDDLLHRTDTGRNLVTDLLRLKNRYGWEPVKEVWRELSARLAEASVGDVWFFGEAVHAQGHDRMTAQDPGKDLRNRHLKKTPLGFRFRYGGIADPRIEPKSEQNLLQRSCNGLVVRLPLANQRP